jgi:PIN domain nuclease of toxin-antitoxin system
LRLLLDTHVWIWSHVDPGRLSDEVRAALLDEDAELWLAITDQRLGSAAPDREGPLADRPGTARVARGSVTGGAASGMRGDEREVALAARELPSPHDDPADRFLAASAWIYDLTLVTADRRLLEVDAIRTLGAR